MRKIYSTLMAIATLALAPMAYAADKAGDLAVGLKGGTLGLGVELNYAISPRINVGVGLNKYSSSMNDTTDDIDYDVDLNLQTVALLVNFHPFAGTFRLTAGAMLNSNELKMKAKPNGATYDIGDSSYLTSDVGTLKAKVDFKKVAPYAGVGWGTSSDSGFGFNLDIGLLMQGKPNVSLNTEGTNPAILAALAVDLDKEEANAENDIKGFTTYPVISAGVSYRF